MLSGRLTELLIMDLAADFVATAYTLVVQLRHAAANYPRHIEPKLFCRYRVMDPARRLSVVVMKQRKLVKI